MEDADNRSMFQQRLLPSPGQILMEGADLNSNLKMEKKSWFIFFQEIQHYSTGITDS